MADRYKQVNRMRPSPDAPVEVNHDQIALIEDSGQILHIPADEGNRHWQGYQAWLRAGNLPEPADN